MTACRKTVVFRGWNQVSGIGIATLSFQLHCPRGQFWIIQLWRYTSPRLVDK